MTDTHTPLTWWRSCKQYQRQRCYFRVSAGCPSFASPVAVAHREPASPAGSLTLLDERCGQDSEELSEGSEASAKLPCADTLLGNSSSCVSES